MGSIRASELKRVRSLLGVSAVGDADAVEVYLCSPLKGLEGFERFCATFVKLMDKRSGKAIPFVLWPDQRELAGRLIAGEWLLIVKARQLGVTTLVCAFAFWKLTYMPMFTVCVINQSKEYAIEFVDEKLRYMWENMPDYFRLALVTDTKTSMVFGERHRSKITAFAGTDKAARSTTANLHLMDEAAYCERMRECLKAGEPTLEKTGGQSVLLSTSAGPTGEFFRRYKLAKGGRGRHRLAFLGWSADPGRTKAWYDEEASNHEDDPNYMHQEYPSTPDEAFLASGGRIYPGFKDLAFPNGHKMMIPPEKLLDEWPRYRGMDLGETHSAFVCLWCVVIPSERRRLTYDPSCVNFEREMLGYSRKEGTDKIIKANDHACDALRYIVATYQIERGWLHVYRELYIENPKGKQMTAQALMVKVKRESGYILVNGEDADPSMQIWRPGERVEGYEGSVFDRARPMIENEANALGMYFEPHRKPIDEPMGKDEEVEAGISMVYGLIMDSLPRRSHTSKTQAEEDAAFFKLPDVMDVMGMRSTRPLVERILKNQKRRAFESAHPGNRRLGIRGRRFR